MVWRERSYKLHALGHGLSTLDRRTPRGAETGVQRLDIDKRTPMVTTSAHGNGASCLLGNVNGPLTLKVRSGEHQGRLLRIRSPKCTIGSDPNCTLRLISAGVRPFHCMILRGQTGMVIRRLSRDTCLNGAGFSERWLQPGDHLNLGPVELEVLPTAIGEPNSPPQRDAEPASIRTASTAAPRSRNRDLASPGPTPAPCHHCAPADGESPSADDPHGPPQFQASPSSAACEACRQQLQRLESMLAMHVQTSNQPVDSRVEQGQEQNGDRKRGEPTSAHASPPASRFPQVGGQEQKGYRELIGALRNELHQLKDQYAKQLAEQDRLLTHVSTVQQDAVGHKVAHEQAVAENQQQVERLQQLRRQLDESVEQLLTSENRAAELQSQLAEAREQARHISGREKSFREEISRLYEHLEATLSELNAERAKRQESLESDEITEQRLRAELDQAYEDLRQAHERIESLQRRADELKQRLAEPSTDQATGEPAADAIQAERETHAREISKWRELADAARQDLQEEREAHQRVRGEWHTERDSLQRELSQRSTTLQELQEKYDDLVKEHERTTEEAESLILSQQQEGQQLLAELHEAKQALRHAEREQARLHNCRDEHTGGENVQTEVLTDEPRTRTDEADAECDQSPSQDASLLECFLDADPREDAYEPETSDESAHEELKVGNEAWHDPEAAAGEEGAEPNSATPGSEPGNSAASPPGQTTTMQWSQLPDAVKSQVLHEDNETLASGTTPEPDRDGFQQQSAACRQNDAAFPAQQPAAGAPLKAAAADQDGLDDHEGIMKQYLDRLLQRATTPSASQCEPASEPPVSSVAFPGSEESAAARETTSEDGAREPQSGPAPQGEGLGAGAAAPQAATSSHGKAERSKDLSKMREVANTSSREAIHRCESKRLGMQTLRPLAAASVLSLFGGVAVAKCHSLLSLQSLVGGIALGVGAVSLLLTGRNYLRWRRVKSQLRADRQ